MSEFTHEDTFWIVMCTVMWLLMCKGWLWQKAKDIYNFVDTLRMLRRMRKGTTPHRVVPQTVEYTNVCFDFDSLPPHVRAHVVEGNNTYH